MILNLSPNSGGKAQQTMVYYRCLIRVSKTTMLWATSIAKNCTCEMSLSGKNRTQDHLHTVMRALPNTCVPIDQDWGWVCIIYVDALLHS